MVGRADFDRGELERAFPGRPAAQLDGLLAQMEKMRVIVPA
jgi:hypothetical protein